MEHNAFSEKMLGHQLVRMEINCFRECLNRFFDLHFLYVYVKILTRFDELLFLLNIFYHIFEILGVCIGIN